MIKTRQELLLQSKSEFFIGAQHNELPFGHYAAVGITESASTGHAIYVRDDDHPDLFVSESVVLSQ